MHLLSRDVFPHLWGNLEQSLLAKDKFLRSMALIRIKLHAMDGCRQTVPRLLKDLGMLSSYAG